MLARHLLPAFGHRPLGAITSSEVRARVTVKAGDLAPATVRQLYGTLNTILAAAVDDRLIARNPCTRKVPLPKQERRQIVPMGTEEVASLIGGAEPRFRALIALAAGTGLRQGKCIGLTVDRNDFLRRTVRVDRQLVQLSGAPPAFAPPKTDASVRVVPLPQVVLDEVAAHLATFPPGPDGLVLTDRHGEAMRRTLVAAQVWNPAARRAGIGTGRSVRSR